jgi:RNA polymerase sigma factor (sigma-70 family)
MITTQQVPTVDSDAQLVEWSLTGDRDAFAQIVEHYKSLVCSITYGATGSLAWSEDLAQETFVTAWKQLRELREPAKLRSWLCAIARNLLGKELRRRGHEPMDAAESLDAIRDSSAPDPLPSTEAISREEEAILWRSLQRIPEAYREPMILFYREQESVERVAEELDLSEDAVKQRLSRGRKLLTDEIAAFVEGTLQRTSPGKAFTLGVLTVLPSLSISAKAATIGAAAAKGSTTAKAAGLSGVANAILGFAPFIFLGGMVGLKMSRDRSQSLQQRESVIRFWRVVVASLGAFAVIPLLLLVCLRVLPPDLRPRILAGLTVWMGILYVAIAAAIGLWAWQRRRAIPRGSVVPTMAERGKRPLTAWVVAATIGAGILFVALLFDMNWKVGRLSTTEAQKIIAERKDAVYSVSQYQDGSRYLWIVLRENGKVSKSTAPAEASTLSLLAEKGITCPTYVQGRDFEILGWPGRLLVLLSLFLLAAGTVILLRGRKNNARATGSHGSGSVS